MIHSNTSQDLEKDNARLQKENWELRNYYKVGCSNTDHNSLYVQLETSNNENDRLKQENKVIKQHLEKLSEENDNHNDKMDLLLNKIESLADVNDKLNTKIESVNQENMKSLNIYGKKMDLISDKMESLAKVIEKLNSKIENSKLNEQHLEINDKVSKTYKEIETCKQDLMFLIYKSKSKIIDNSSFKMINDWIDDGKTIGFELLYKASENEFSGPSFHSVCDDKGSTITLIETTDGCVFGGYNSQSWNDVPKWYGDNKCFIFTLVNKHGIKPTKYSPGTANKNYVGSGKEAGPIFGDGYDIGVSLDPKKCTYQSFPSTYIDTTGKGKSTLTPSREFNIKTIEIYKCI
ncbi:hypothetical protein CYY_009729 [Polysphondylium violaceum]|uniref:TLDc domain-containing protein n=1 Tax=Polysphondylium violaceum TaxID=133409 RepID=A0A8J4PJR1_9MYCE|nr:hypothetical protein CYY_009729 [Polysphondylium violaceum]